MKQNNKEYFRKISFGPKFEVGWLDIDFNLVPLLHQNVVSTIYLVDLI